MNSSLTAEDSEVIKKKLLQDAKSQGIKVVHDETATNAAYLGSKSGRKLRNAVAKLKRKGGNSAVLAKQIEDAAKLNLDGEKMWGNLGKDAIVIGKSGSLSQADVLSHEIGHSQYMRGGRSKSIIGKLSHKGTALSKMATTKGGAGLSAAHGFRSGQKAARLKNEGKKESTWGKVKSVALPAAITAPLLVAEGKASLNGYRRMKKLGASKELLKQSRARLGNAWGSYAAASASPIVSGEVGRMAGKLYEGAKIKSRQSRQDREK